MLASLENSVCPGIHWCLNKRWRLTLCWTHSNPFIALTTEPPCHHWKTNLPMCKNSSLGCAAINVVFAWERGTFLVSAFWFLHYSTNCLFPLTYSASWSYYKSGASPVWFLNTTLAIITYPLPTKDWVSACWNVDNLKRMKRVLF